MKKLTRRFLLGLGTCLLLLLTLAALSKHSVQSTDELLVSIQKYLGISEPLRLLGEYEDDFDGNARLFCIISAENGSEVYFAVKVEKTLFRYTFRKIPLTERGGGIGIYTAHWGNGVILISANPRTATLKLSAQGTDTLIPISSVPFSYYWDISEYQTCSYGFYDQSGAVVWE